MQISNLILTATLTSLLSACASKDTLLPVPDQNMKAVYDQHMQGIGEGKIFDTRSVLRRDMIEGDVSLSDYVRTEKTQLQARFQRIPNPTLYMFVAPHLASSNGVPIPGYLTEFQMWDKEHYALPGEVSDMSESFEGAE